MSERRNLSMETLIEALEALPDGIAIYDKNNQSMYVNEVSRRRFGPMYAALDNGVPLRDAIRVSVAENMPGATDAQIDAYTDYLASAYDKRMTYDVRTADGRVVRASFEPMSNGRKVAISVDVTDIRKREKELEAARKEADAARKAAEAASASKSAFLANMSHEIRTPLNGILGMAQVLAMGELSPLQREQVLTVLESGKTLMTLLNDVLDLSKIEAGKLDLVTTDMDLRHLLKRIQRLWRASADEKGLQLAVMFDADLPEMMNFDGTRVQQCVSNLVSNAIKFTSEGRVEIWALAKPLEGGDHMVQIRIRDTGIGMDRETAGKLFQPFQQADESTQRKFGGTGLGLSITRRLAEMMGGNAVVTSELGRGSEFTLSFRASAPKSSMRPASSTTTLSTDAAREALKASSLRILLVDDHPINRQVAGLFLRPMQPRIVEAVNGQEALHALAREAFDLVLLDMHMPVMDGPTCIANIRASGEAWANVPVIALTADAMSGDRERYLAMGMDGYLSKPLAERDLVAEITRVRAGKPAGGAMKAVG